MVLRWLESAAPPDVDIPSYGASATSDIFAVAIGLFSSDIQLGLLGQENPFLWSDTSYQKKE